MVMKKNSLSPNNGLSLSQAQSISNLCHQRALEISNKLASVNNASKSVEVDGKEHITVKGRELPIDVVDLLKMKAKFHACQGFLMENIKAKDAMLLEAKKMQADLSVIKYPDDWKSEEPKILSQVGEEWGWAQLSVAEVNEYTEAEAYASHIGQFIHDGSILDTLREELPNIPDIEWMTIKDGVKSPVKINIHHTPERLLNVHEELAAIHRGFEQKVNYFKAKVKNLVTEENARIAKINADAQNESEKINKTRYNEYQVAFAKVTEEIKTLKSEFEKTRQDRIREIASMRIQVDPRFQETINEFLSQLPE
jgi:hypothetical protein